jgi:hypothetical protein
MEFKSKHLVPQEMTILVSSDPIAGAKNISPTGDSFTVQLTDNLAIPSGALNVNLSVQEATVWNVVPNISAALGNNKMYITEGGTPHNLTIPDGLYDLVEFNATIARLLENSGATTVPSPLVAFTGDDATQKVVMRVNYVNVVVDYTPADTPRLILGFDATVFPVNPAAPVNYFAPNTANFNTVEYFLIHTDLIQKGISVNGNYNQSIATVLITEPPGSQIVSSPQNPPAIDAQDLAGTSKKTFRVWITDQNNNFIDTLSEVFTARIKISYLEPFIW